MDRHYQTNLKTFKNSNMEQTTNKLLHEKAPWFKSWFDSAHYHRLYANRNEQEAQHFMDALLVLLQPAKGSSIIDVGCGAGRHSKYLASKGFDVTGIDTARSSIQQANSFQSASLRFIQHDMRLPFGKSKYDYVFNCFTSFGYFEGLYQNQVVIQNMGSALKQDGTIVIDYLNVAYAEERLIAVEEKEIDGINYQITRWTDETHFFKKIVITDDAVEEPFEYVEKVAKFTVSTFRYMFYTHNLKIAGIYGDYALSEYNSIQSPRLIMIVKHA
jgi:SAM-dependent methyltransferase